MTNYPDADALRIQELGPRRVPSPLIEKRTPFKGPDDRVLLSTDLATIRKVLVGGGEPPTFEMAGPRREIFFDPADVCAGIVTCGGLCPGLNDVIRSVVHTLHHNYGVQRGLGFRFGYAGLTPDSEHAPLELRLDHVKNIHQQGGTILGSSRGPQDVGRMVDGLQKHGVNLLFVLGGDGTLRGGSALCAEIRRRGLDIGVVGIPKTIDNDIQWVSMSFGFFTAVEEAQRTVMAAHAEARGAWNGVGLVKLMGRHSGFITAHATLANSDVNLCLIPEVPFTLEGSGGLIDVLDRRLKKKGHAVIVVAEGAGQDLLEASGAGPRDASGNVRLQDIGTFLAERVARHFEETGLDGTIKYIDPSYIIRSLPANSIDSEYCLLLGQHAAHAGMAGKTDMLIGHWNQHFTHVPLALATESRKRLPTDHGAWQRVLEATGQPASMVGRG